MKTTRWALLLMLLWAPASAQETQSEGPAAGEAQTAQQEADLSVEPNFQPQIFWAYGLVCFLLFAFTLYSIHQTRSLEGRVSYLKERFDAAFPDRAETSR